jgi:hypothetical protein
MTRKHRSQFAADRGTDDEGCQREQRLGDREAWSVGQREAHKQDVAGRVGDEHMSSFKKLKESMSPVTTVMTTSNEGSGPCRESVSERVSLE